MRHGGTEERPAYPKVSVLSGYFSTPAHDGKLTKSYFTTNNRQVSEEEGQELANQLKCAWVEVSARHNQNVGE